MELLTEEDINSIRYYWDKSGDPTQWVHWDEKRGAIEEQFPELIKVWNGYKTAERLMGIVLDSLEVPYEEEVTQIG